MKKTLLKSVLVSAIALSAFNTQAGGIPVIDVGNIAQAILQVQEAQKRLGQLKAQFQASTGNAGLGALIGDKNVRAALNKYLPKGYQDVTQVMNNGDLGALQTLYKNVQKNEASFAGKGKERLAATLMLNQARMDGLLETLDTRNQKVDSLVSQLNATTDLSSKADLANSLSAEQALINTEMNKMSVLMKQMEQQEKLAERQAASEYRQNRRR